MDEMDDRRLEPRASEAELAALDARLRQDAAAFGGEPSAACRRRLDELVARLPRRRSRWVLAVPALAAAALLALALPLLLGRGEPGGDASEDVASDTAWPARAHSHVDVDVYVDVDADPGAEAGAAVTRRRLAQLAPLEHAALAPLRRELEALEADARSCAAALGRDLPSGLRALLGA